MNRKMSAKDIAFDKERAAFRKEIRDLRHELSMKDIEVRQMKDIINQKDNEISEKDDWIRRLLNYMDLSEDDLKRFVENERLKADIHDSFSFANAAFQKYFGGLYL